MKPTRSLPPFQTLIDAHAGRVARFLRGMVPANDVDDAVQETFLAGLRAYADFDGVNPSAWLLTIARHKAIDEHRASNRRPEPLAEPDRLEAGSQGGDGNSDGDELWTAVSALPPKQRAAIVLRFALDLRYREVGEALGCSEAAARRNVHEAISSLRDRFEQQSELEITR